MDEIIRTFGIDWKLIVIQIFNFTLLLAVLTYFLYKPLLKVIDDRKKLVEKGVRDAEEAKTRLSSAEQESSAIVSKAVTEASDIVKRGTEAAARESASIVKEAHDQSSRILSESEKKALALADSIRAKSESEIAKVALLTAEKILRERA